MEATRYVRLALSGLRVAAGAFIALTGWELFHLRALREMALVADEAPRNAALVLLPLAAAWGLVIGWSVRSTKMRLLGAVLAWALSLGACASVALMIAFVLIPELRPLRPTTAVDFLAKSVVVQLVALVLAHWVLRLLRDRVSLPSTTTRGLAAGGALLSFGLTIAAGAAAPALCVMTEARAIGDLRTILSAEDIYQRENGRFGTLECLVDPHGCLPNYPAGAPIFLPPSILRATRCGYRFTFYPTPGSPSELGSLEDYAVTAVPVEPGRSGGRGFCTDSTGAIRFSPDGRLPAPSDGRCPESLEFLQ